MYIIVILGVMEDNYCDHFIPYPWLLKIRKPIDCVDSQTYKKCLIKLNQ